MGEYKSKHFADKKDTMPPLKDLIVGDNYKKSVLGTHTYVLLVLVVILIASIVSYGIYKRERSRKTVACSQVIIEQGNILNGSGNMSAFGELAKVIRQKDNYAKDPNCLYILTEYQITVGDLPAAKAAIDHLRSTYGSGYAFDKGLDGGQASLTNLLQQFNLVQNAQDNSKGRIDPVL